MLVSTKNIEQQAQTIGRLSLLVALLITVWVLFASHYRQIYRYKLHRIHELEAHLGMTQHRRFTTGGEYKVFGVKGHHLDLAMYVFVSLGGLFVGAVVAGFDQSYLVSVGVVLVGVVWFLVNERRTDARLRGFSVAPDRQAAQHPIPNPEC